MKYVAEHEDTWWKTVGTRGRFSGGASSDTDGEQLFHVDEDGSPHTEHMEDSQKTAESAPSTANDVSGGDSG